MDYRPHVLYLPPMVGINRCEEYPGILHRYASNPEYVRPLTWRCVVSVYHAVMHRFLHSGSRVSTDCGTSCCVQNTSWGRMYEFK